MKPISKTKCNEVERLYNKGLGVKAIATEVKIHRGTVSGILKKKGIWLKEKKRPFKNLYNIKFFKYYTKESCYWAGFILADGNLTSKRKCLQIGLASVDKNHLKKFSDAIKFSGPIYDDIRKNGYISQKIRISGKWLYDDLNNNFDIYSKKSLNAIFTKKIPKKFLSNYIRGYFDGDGSLYKAKNVPLASIGFTGTFNVLNSIADIFDCVLKIEKLSIYVYKKRNASQLSYYGKKAKIILDWLYSTSNEQIRLERKYKKYEQCIKEKTL